jgi:hypothetical protein
MRSKREILDHRTYFSNIIVFFLLLLNKICVKKIMPDTLQHWWNRILMMDKEQCNGTIVTAYFQFPSKAGAARQSKCHGTFF